MTVLSSDDLRSDRHLHLLLLGAPKTGKSTMVIASSPGPVRVLLCESDSALAYPKKIGCKFSFERTYATPDGPPPNERMLEAIHDARKAIKKGEIGTLIVDPMTTLASQIEEFCIAKTPKDRYGNDQTVKIYPWYRRLLRQICEQLLQLRCNVVVIMHHIEKPDVSISGSAATPRSGEGHVPNLAGAARTEIPALFPNVVFMDFESGKRIITTAATGVWGPGCRGLKGVRSVPAEVCLPDGSLKPEKRLKKNGIHALIKAFKDT